VNKWLLLLAAILLEVAGTTSMKLSQGFTRPVPSAFIFVFYAGAFTALTYALRWIDVSVAYAVWSGLGTALMAVIGAVYFGEVLTPARAACILLIVVGVVGLNLAGGP
jgi:small multidrug resistance pump